MSRKNRFWLCFPPVVLCLLDGGVTLLGQPAQYWAGDYSCANEFNPIFAPILQWHPLAFVAGGTLYMVGFSLVILYFPVKVAVCASFGFSLGHAIGAASWFTRQGSWGWLAGIGELVLAERLTSWAWKRAVTDR
jgi:hypothetical protein